MSDIPPYLYDGQNSVFWFRRDLRLHDNHALYQALKENSNVIPVFIFDENILRSLPDSDRRLVIIHQAISKLDSALKKLGSSLLVIKSTPAEFFDRIDIRNLYFNRDYEPYALERDMIVTNSLQKKGVTVHSFKDHVIFEPGEVLKDDGKPYTVFTPYSKKWLKRLTDSDLKSYDPDFSNLLRISAAPLPSLEQLGFRSNNSIEVTTSVEDSMLESYGETRNIPSLMTTRLGTALRFGLISTREIVQRVRASDSLLNELIWREFFQMILFHFPESVSENFKRNYDKVEWIYNQDSLDAWKEGKTGYPIVDAGMRELNATGYMHNRVRMITASFLVKHLLHHWSHGEAYFAEKLDDFELASNVGNWQWAAGTGCDAAPYFRVFNPQSQQEKFDPDFQYIKKWVPEYGTDSYGEPIVEHNFARQRAIDTYRIALQN